MLKRVALIIAAIALILLPIKAKALGLSAESWALCDESGKIIASHGDRRMAMASTTKIMTALVVIENNDMDTVVSVPREAVGVEGSSVYLKEGQRITVEQLLYALLLQSANDAAETLAIHTAGNIASFADMMNSRAQDIGLSDTHFTNPHGLSDDDHYTTASELAKITAEAMKNDTFRKIVSTYKYTFPVIDSEGKQSASHTVVNHNKLLKSYSGCIGVKTGFTKASGRCLVSAAERGGTTLIAVTLNAPNDWNDHRQLLDYGFSLCKSVDLYLLCPQLYLDVVGGKTRQVRAVPSENIRVTVPRDAEIDYIIECRRFLYAPIKEGDIVGQIIYTSNGERIASSDLCVTENCDKTEEKITFFDWLFGLFGISK